MRHWKWLPRPIIPVRPTCRSLYQSDRVTRNTTASNLICPKESYDRNRTNGGTASRGYRYYAFARIRQCGTRRAGGWQSSHAFCVLRGVPRHQRERERSDADERRTSRNPVALRVASLVHSWGNSPVDQRRWATRNLCSHGERRFARERRFGADISGEISSERRIVPARRIARLARTGGSQSLRGSRTAPRPESVSG